MVKLIEINIISEQRKCFVSRNNFGIHWYKLCLALLGSVMLDLAASLVSKSSLKEALIHAAVIALSVAGSFFMDAYKKADEKPKRVSKTHKQ